LSSKARANAEDFAPYSRTSSPSTSIIPIVKILAIPARTGLRESRNMTAAYLSKQTGNPAIPEKWLI